MSIFNGTNLSEKKYIMISYNHEDYVIAEGFTKLLQKNGVPCWIAPKSIKPGSNYMNDIAEAIKNAAAVALLVSKKSQGSEWVLREIQGAIEYGVMVIPVFIEDCELVFPFDFYLGRNQTVDRVSFEDLLKNKSDTISSFIKRLQEITNMKQENVVIDGDIVLFDNTKLLNDIGSLFDALISIMIKAGLTARMFGTYNIDREVKAVEDFLLSSSAHNLSLAYGHDPFATRILLYCITSDECVNNLQNASEKAASIIQQLLHPTSDAEINQDLLSSIHSIYQERANRNELYLIFKKQEEERAARQEQYTIAKFLFLKENVKDDPRIDMFLAVYERNTQAMNEAIHMCRLKFGDDFDPQTVTIGGIFDEYSKLLKKFKYTE